MKDSSYRSTTDAAPDLARFVNSQIDREMRWRYPEIGDDSELGPNAEDCGVSNYLYSYQAGGVRPTPRAGAAHNRAVTSTSESGSDANLQGWIDRLSQAALDGELLELAGPGPRAQGLWPLPTRRVGARIARSRPLRCVTSSPPAN